MHFELRGFLIQPGIEPKIKPRTKIRTFLSFKFDYFCKESKKKLEGSNYIKKVKNTSKDCSYKKCRHCEAIFSENWLSEHKFEKNEIINTRNLIVVGSS